MPKERKYYQRRNLGSMRIDLPLKKKRQFLKKIITFKESYHKVSADFKKETGKHLPRSTLKKWKNTGQAIIDAADAGSSRRHNYKQSVEKKTVWRGSFAKNKIVKSRCRGKSRYSNHMRRSSSRRSILDWEEANVTPKAPENNKEMKFQQQITSFFAKKK